MRWHETSHKLPITNLSKYVADTTKIELLARIHFCIWIEFTFCFFSFRSNNLVYCLHDKCFSIFKHKVFSANLATPLYLPTHHTFIQICMCCFFRCLNCICICEIWFVIFRRKKTHKIAIRKLSSVCIFACLPIRSNSIKSNSKINTANIYLTTNFDQIIDTGVTDIERKKKPATKEKKEASRRTFFLL